MRYSIFPIFNKKILSLASIIKIKEIIGDEYKKKVEVKSNLNIKIPNNSKEGVYVYMCWLYMWCYTLTEQDENERVFRLNQLR